jgi:hypothetical protein
MAFYYKFEPCDNIGNSFYSNIPVPEFLPVYQAITFQLLPGPLVPGTSNPLDKITKNKCYEITKEDLEDPPAALINIPWTNPLLNIDLYTDCPECAIGPIPCVTQPCYYIFTPCCGGHGDAYQVENGPLVEDGVYYNPTTQQCYIVNLNSEWTVSNIQSIDANILELINDGCNDITCLVPCNPCQCYRVRYTGVVDPEGPTTESMNYVDCALDDQVYDIPLDGSWGPKTCMKAYTLPEGDFEVVSFGDCIPTDTTGDVYECPPCYMLTDCNGELDPIYTLSSSIGLYIDTNQVIKIDGSDACWTPSVSDNNCECAVDVTVAYSYYNCPECLNPKGYKLTECTTDEVIYTNQDLSTYIGQTVELDCGGCWIVEALDLPAPSTQPVTIVSAFDGCKTCNGEYFLLEDCTGKVESVITYTDLSAYVGKVIKLKYCPETCWEVSVSTTSANAGEVLVDAEFEDCPECYLTLPCVCNTVTNTSNETITYTYYDCDGELQEVTVNAGQTSPKLCVLVWESAFEPNNCDCILVTTSFLTPGVVNDYQATPTGNIVGGQPEYGYTVQVGATTAFVTISWTGTNWSVYLNGIKQKIYLTVPDPDFPGCPIGPSGLPDGWFYANGSFSTQLCPPVPLPFPGTIQEFGNCIDGVCPRPVFPKRKVKPGYDSPTCTPEKYEKIVCSFSEWMYKDVMEKRYGISNCCPDELMKWEIKKEILDLEVLVNPDYVCQPDNSCCTPVPNVYRGTCNSQ